MKTLLTLALLLSPCILFAQPPNGVNVPPRAKTEALVRGSMVEDVGGIQAPIQTKVIESLSIPDRDDHKFNATVIISSDPKWAPGCNQLLSDIATNEHLSAWMRKESPSIAHMNYQVRNIDHVQQEWWFEKIRPKVFPVGDDGKPVLLVNSKGVPVPLFPVLIIQPPLNGELGNPKRVLAIIQGYNHTPEELSNMLRDVVAKWAIEVHENKGHAQIGRNEPPFVTPPTKEDIFDATNGPMRVLPAHIQPEPKILTARQIKELLPNAPREFRAEIAEQEFTDPNDVKEAWLKHREDELNAKSNTPKPVQLPPADAVVEPRHLEDDSKKKTPETEAIPSSEPALDVGPALGDLLRGCMELATFLALMYLAFSQYRQTSQPRLSIQVSSPGEKPITTSDTRSEQIA